jgi:hypothetical protein
MSWLPTTVNALLSAKETRALANDALKTARAAKDSYKWATSKEGKELIDKARKAYNDVRATNREIAAQRNASTKTEVFRGPGAAGNVATAPRSKGSVRFMEPLPARAVQRAIRAGAGAPPPPPPHSGTTPRSSFRPKAGAPFAPHNTMPKNRRSKKSVSLRPSGGSTKIFAMNTGVNVVDRAPTRTRVSQNIRHNLLNLDGVRVTGSQPFVSLLRLTGSNDFFGAGLATRRTNSLLYINADTLNGPLTGQAQFYERYCFRKLVFEYIPIVSTGTTGAGVLCYQPDADINDAANGFDESRQMTDSVTFPYRQPVSLTVNYTGNELWWVSKDGLPSLDDLANRRQTTQGMVCGYPSDINDLTGTTGYINVHYVCDLFQSVPAQSVSVLLMSSYERKLCKDALARLRESRKQKRVLGPNDGPDTFELVEK